MKPPEFTIRINPRMASAIEFRGRCKDGTPRHIHRVAGEILTQALQQMSLASNAPIRRIEFSLHR